MRDRASNPRIVTEAAAKIAALRARLRESLGTLWGKAENGSSCSLDEIADAWSAAVTTIRSCKSTVTELYEAAGTSSLYTDCPIERAHRDIHAAA